MLFFKIIQVLNKLEFSNLRLIFIITMFLLLAVLDLIGLSLLAPYIQTLIQQSVPKSLDIIMHNILGKSYSYSQSITIMSIAILVLYIFKSIFSLYVLNTIFSMVEKVQANLKLLLTRHALTINFVEFSLRNSATFQYNINMVSSAFSQKVILVSLRLISDGMILLMRNFIFCILRLANISIYVRNYINFFLHNKIIFIEENYKARRAYKLFQ